MKNFICLCLFILITVCTPSNHKSGAKEQDFAKNGYKQSADKDTYTNPVGDNIQMGDPFVMKHDGKYYLYGTTASDGFKCWSSGNLVDWKYEGYAYRETDSSWGDNTFWAPEVHHYKDKFYMVYSCKGKNNVRDGRMLLCIAESDNPTGPFTDKYAPWFDDGYSCIDAHLFIDKDKTPYLYFNKVGVNGKWPDDYMFGIIFTRELDPGTLKPSGDTVFCVQASQDWENPRSMHSRCNEGAFVFHHNGIYYMTYSANHYADPFYGIGYATARSPLGPWIKSQENPLAAKDSAKGVFGPGHNSITTSPDGSEMFMVYHTHISHDNKNRVVNIDRLVIDDKGKLNLKGPTRTPQSLP